MLVSLPRLHFHTTSSYYRRGSILETYTKRIFNCLFHVMGIQQRCKGHRVQGSSSHPMMPIFILILLCHFDSKIPPCHTDGWPDENQFRSLSQKFQLGINRSEYFKSKPLELKNAKCVLDDKYGCQLVCGSAGCYLNLNVGICLDGEWRGDGTL